MNWTTDVVRDEDGNPPAVHRFETPLVRVPDLEGNLALASERVGGDLYAYLLDRCHAMQIAQLLNTVDAVTAPQVDAGNVPNWLVEIDPDRQAEFREGWYEGRYNVLRVNGHVIGFVRRDNEATLFLLTSLNNPENEDIEPALSCECEEQDASTACRFCHALRRRED